MQTPHMALAQAVRQGDPDAIEAAAAQAISAADAALQNLEELLVGPHSDDRFVAPRARQMRELLQQYRDDLALLQAAPARGVELLERLQAVYDVMESLHGEVARTAPPSDPIEELQRDPRLLLVLQTNLQQSHLPHEATEAALEALAVVLSDESSAPAWDALAAALRRIEQVRAELLEDACNLDLRE
ncbi:MAG: hypothetical protein ACYCW6_00645 [Candidatus Xenobia bacterium]